MFDWFRKNYARQTQPLGSREGAAGNSLRALESLPDPETLPEAESAATVSVDGSLDGGAGEPSVQAGSGGDSGWSSRTRSSGQR